MNSLGSIFKVTSFGESHGSHVGCIVEGCSAGLKVDIEKIQQAVNRRKTNRNNFSSTRNESDSVEIVSGIFEGFTIGSPICILIKNEDAQSKDYDELKDVFRPGHADFSYQEKYGIRDHRGGGRSSIRITAPMVAAGELARQFIVQYFPINLLTYVSQIGEIKINTEENISLEEIENSLVRCPDKNKSEEMIVLIERTKAEGDTLGGAIKCIIKNLPAGIGEPVFGKLQAQLAHAMMNINTSKSFEYGEGAQSAMMKGSTHNDSFVVENEKIKTITNHHGGILGGISTGMDINFTVHFKPISSIQQSQNTIDKNNESATIKIQGRHDVCAVPRAVPIVEAYTYITLADMILHQRLSKI